MQPFSEHIAPPRMAVSMPLAVGVYAMALYHLVWDLNIFKLTSFALFTDPFWLGVRTVIVSAFLFLAGLSLVLADRRGRGWLAFGRRVIIVAFGAALVSFGAGHLSNQLRVFRRIALHCYLKSYCVPVFAVSCSGSILGRAHYSSGPGIFVPQYF